MMGEGGEWGVQGEGGEWGVQGEAESGVCRVRGRRGVRGDLGKQGKWGLAAVHWVNDLIGRSGMGTMSRMRIVERVSEVS